MFENIAKREGKKQGRDLRLRTLLLKAPFLEGEDLQKEAEKRMLETWQDKYISIALRKKQFSDNFILSFLFSYTDKRIQVIARGN